VTGGLGGNLCRCGTYMGVREAALDAAKRMSAGRA
jgi:xanthine dehydrogenase YagT iron-sulfur-binding subunit